MQYTPNIGAYHLNHVRFCVGREPTNAAISHDC